MSSTLEQSPVDLNTMKQLNQDESVPYVCYMDRNDVNCTYNNRIFSHLKVSITPVQNANFENNICEVGQISSNISVIKYDFKIVQCTKIRQIQLAISLTIIIINNAKV